MENYKEKYEKALERGSRLWESDSITRENYEYMFPEVKEREGDRIKKEIRDFICWAIDRGSITKEQKEQSNSWLAWLEKQSDQKPSEWSEEDERIRKECISIIDAWDKSCRLQGDYCEVASKCIAWLEKQGGAKLLEKQGDQKPADKVEPKFRVGDCIRRKGGEVDYRIVTISDDYYFCENNRAWTITSQDYFELVDQKPANETNPKFKVGDWIVSECNNVAYIESISKTEYNLQCIDGYHERVSIDYVDRCWRLWTIQDAKDGDVLVTESRPFIFRGFLDICYPGHPVAYCGINTENNFYITSNNYGHWTNNSCLPATKKQCDFLFLKMKEAGYEWDAEKKELKKKDK